MKKFTSALLASVITLSMMPTSILATGKQVFTDVKSTDYCAPATKALAEMDILEGYESGEFGPEKSITRAEMAAVICRMIDKESEAKNARGKTDFDDVNKDHWASGYINIASEEGIVNGDGNSSFRPEDNVKYEEAIKMVVCALGFEDEVEVNSKDWARGYLDVADDKNITDDLKGEKGEPATRADVAVMVYSGLCFGLEAPKASLKAGSYSKAQSVTLTTDTEDADIYYTLDGKEPTAKSTKYTKAISITKNCTLKAVSIKNETLLSDVLSVDYKISVNKFIGGSYSGGGSSTEQTYTVTFDLNYEGATGAPKSQKVKVGETAEAPEMPEREGFLFVGWYKEKECTQIYDFVKGLINEDCTVYARWVDISDTTDTDGDKLTDPLEEFYGTDKTNPDTDGDGLSDYIEVNSKVLDPKKADSDDDGVGDGLEDTDLDGLINKDEVSLGTSIISEDTDSDGLKDKEEIETYKTNPVSADTDSDGVSDGKEIELGTDPTTADAVFNMNVKADNTDSVKASVKVDLSGEQVETLSVEPVDNEVLFPQQMPGYLGKAYDFNVEGTFTSATISFEFDSDADADPVIYYFNEEEQKLEALETSINGNVASANVTHFSTYILVDRKIYEGAFQWQDTWESESNYTGVEIVLVVDDSGSMGPQGANNDPYNTRLTVAKDLIERLPVDSKVGVLAFDEFSVNLTNGLTKDKETAKSYLTTTYFKSDGYYTYMYSGIESALGMFEAAEDNILKMMVVLSDGAAHDTEKHQSVISMANSNNIKIYTVGLGNSTSYFNSYLRPLAENTGGEFYLASNAGELANIYKDINEKIDINTDSDEDKIPDYYEDNMVLFNGVKIELDKNKKDTDGDGILDGDEIELQYIYNPDKTKVIVVGKIHSYPHKKDSDGDGILDPDDKEPLKWNVSYRDLVLLSHAVYKDYPASTVLSDKNDSINRAGNLKELEGWRIVESIYNPVTGLEMAAYAKDKNLVFAARGSESHDLVDILQDWVLADIIGFLSGFNAQLPAMETFIKSASSAYAGRYDNIYVTGHSLGGYIALMASSQLVENGFENEIKKVLTFNGLGMSTASTLGQLLDIDDYYKLLKIRSKIFNYKTPGDVVAKIGRTPGKDISVPMAASLGKWSVNNAHSLVTFAERFSNDVRHPEYAGYDSHGLNDEK